MHGWRRTKGLAKYVALHRVEVLPDTLYCNLKKWQVIPTSSTMPIAHKYPPFSLLSLLWLWFTHLAMRMCCHVFNFYVNFSSTFPRGDQADDVVLQPKIEFGPQTLPILAKQGPLINHPGNLLWPQYVRSYGFLIIILGFIFCE